MGFMNFIGKQFLDIIEWEDSSNDTIVYKFPMQDNEIQQGAQLIVRPGQTAVFLNEGKIADVFHEGTYKLETKNLPLLADLKGWAFGFKSPFKSDVYFINTKTFIDQKWGTQNPVLIVDPKFEQVEVRAFGTFAFHIAEPSLFIGTVSSTNRLYKVEDIKGQLKEFVLSEFSNVVAKQGISVVELSQKYNVINQAMKQELEDEFKQLGLEIDSFVVSNISLPDDIRDMLKERTRINMMGGMENYKDVRKLDALEKMSENENGGMGVAAMGMGAGLGFGQMLSQGLQGSSNNAPIFQPHSGGVVCSSCHQPIQNGAKFCGGCGTKVEANPSGTFCTECGHKNESGTKFCGNCGIKL